MQEELAVRTSMAPRKCSCGLRRRSGACRSKHGGETLEDMRPVLEKAVRDANIAIIEGNDASQHEVGIASIRIAEMIFADERAAIPIESFQKKFGVTLSLSNTVGRSGVHEVLEPELSEDVCR